MLIYILLLISILFLILVNLAVLYITAKTLVDYRVAINDIVDAINTLLQNKDIKNDSRDS